MSLLSHFYIKGGNPSNKSVITPCRYYYYCYHHSVIYNISLSLTQAKSKGFHSKYDLGVKYAEKQQRHFAPEKNKEGRNVIGLQVRTDFLHYLDTAATAIH